MVCISPCFRKCQNTEAVLNFLQAERVTFIFECLTEGQVLVESSSAEIILTLITYLMEAGSRPFKYLAGLQGLNVRNDAVVCVQLKIRQVGSVLIQPVGKSQIGIFFFF